MTSGLSWADVRLESAVGEGQSGIVYRAILSVPAYGLPVGAPVAIKRYKPWIFQEAGQFERVLREIDVGRRVNHTNLLRIFGGVFDPEGHPALVMEFCDGPTLEATLFRNRLTASQIDLFDGLEILRQVALAITALHKAGVTHRDIKPANILLTSRGAVLTDFGVVDSLNLPEQTTTGAFLGTIRYAAPEYLFGEGDDPSDDLFSFGALAYEVLSGQMFFAAYTHWARLIIGRVERSGWNGDYLERIRTEYGSEVASFVGSVLHQTITGRPDRSLDLEAFASAVSRHAWTDDIAVDSH